MTKLTGSHSNEEYAGPMSKQRTKAWTWVVGIGRWCRRVFIDVSALGFASFLLLTFTPIGNFISARLIESTPLDELPQADAIVVLGGDLFRTADAVRVYRAGKAPMIIISGETNDFLPILRAGLVPPGAVRIDGAPKRTVDHPRTILSVNGISRSSKLIIISSALQQRRALRLFQKAGYTNVWVCSMEWERYLAEGKGRMPSDQFSRILYEFGAWIKGGIVD